MPLQVLNGPTIAARASLSEGLDCSAGRVVRITMPTAWDRAQLTFQISTDGVFYNDLVGLDGYEVMFSNVVPGTAVVVPEKTGRAIGWLKLRSGTREKPVPQSAARVFAVAIMADPQSAPAATRADEVKSDE
jgi:hypothetical protein